MSRRDDAITDHIEEAIANALLRQQQPLCNTLTLGVAEILATMRSPSGKGSRPNVLGYQDPRDSNGRLRCLLASRRRSIIVVDHTSAREAKRMGAACAASTLEKTVGGGSAEMAGQIDS
jgi:hypothetical protein